MSFLGVAARNAEQLAQFARRNGIHGESVFDFARNTWVCVVRTPWHDEPRPVRDREDVAWIVAELDHEETEAA